MKKTFLFLTTFLLVCLVFCSVQAADAPLETEMDLNELSSEEESFAFVIQTGDVLRIHIWGNPATGVVPVIVRVSPEGKIYMPLLGEVKISGLTALKAAKKLDELYLDGYLTDPQCTVLIQEREEAEERKFSIKGAVASPGKYPIQGTITLIDAIKLAGGLRKDANSKEIKVMRKNEDGTVSEYLLDLEKYGIYFVIKGRDIIDVTMFGKFTIYGEIKKPGNYLIMQDLGVADAILMAGGFTDIASKNSVKIIRYVDGKRKVIKVPVAHIFRTGKTSDDVLLQDGDIVVVPESWF